MPSDIRPSPVPSDGVISHARQPNAVPVLVADFEGAVYEAELKMIKFHLFNENL